MKSKVVAFIFARGGSKGLPGKNIRTLGDKPLIAHSITFAKENPRISDVIVSTDSEEIAEVSKNWGAKVPFLRPASLAGDTVREMDAWRHAVSHYMENISSFDCFLSLPAVSPLRQHEDLDRVIEKVSQTEVDFVLTGVESETSPYANLIEKKETQGFKLCSANEATRRQDTKTVYRIIPMYYACKPDRIFQYDNLFHGRVDMIEIPRSRAADVDTLEDFEYLEFLYNKIQLPRKG